MLLTSAIDFLEVNLLEKFSLPFSAFPTFFTPGVPVRSDFFDCISGTELQLQ